jgi:prepilin-type N-terminal cleavage/methylation domain-containing protein
MRNDRGFTLIETMITTIVLVVGLVGVASIFSYSAGTNVITRQRTAATTLLYDKMEEFKSAPLNDSRWTVDGGFTSVRMGSEQYMLSWQIMGTMPRIVTVIVYAEKAGITNRRMELIRATTMVSN